MLQSQKSRTCHWCRLRVGFYMSSGTYGDFLFMSPGFHSLVTRGKPESVELIFHCNLPGCSRDMHFDPFHIIFTHSFLPIYRIICNVPCTFLLSYLALVLLLLQIVCREAARFSGMCRQAQIFDKMFESGCWRFYSSFLLRIVQIVRFPVLAFFRVSLIHKVYGLGLRGPPSLHLPSHNIP